MKGPVSPYYCRKPPATVSAIHAGIGEAFERFVVCKDQLWRHGWHVHSSLGTYLSCELPGTRCAESMLSKFLKGLGCIHTVFQVSEIIDAEPFFPQLFSFTFRFSFLPAIRIPIDFTLAARRLAISGKYSPVRVASHPVFLGALGGRCRSLRHLLGLQIRAWEANQGNPQAIQSGTPLSRVARATPTRPSLGLPCIQADPHKLVRSGSARVCKSIPVIIQLFCQAASCYLLQVTVRSRWHALQQASCRRTAFPGKPSSFQGCASY